jgi:hypothetical protein
MEGAAEAALIPKAALSPEAALSPRRAPETSPAAAAPPRRILPTGAGRGWAICVELVATKNVRALVPPQVCESERERARARERERGVSERDVCL